MCGIAGGINFSGDFFPSPEIIGEFSKHLRFRGPDQSGSFHERFHYGTALSFEHKRLSIIDLSEAGRQPMFSPSRQTLITYNGEIYNYKTLRNELEERGNQFLTNSDTEVLLIGFEVWGIEQLLKKIDGMFAFALYSIKDDKLYLVKDRFGKKPLYYYHDQKKLAFSSDIRSFKCLNISRTIDKYALGYFFNEMATPQKRSIWNEIRKIPAGSYAVFSKEEFTIQSYWEIDFSKKNDNDRSSIVKDTESLLIKAVQKRLVGDVNVSSFLSGGIDSSLVASIMATCAGKKINTYSVGFKETDFNELPYARKVAEKYQTNHHEIILQPEDVKITDDIIDEFGEPFADSSMIPTYYISKKISASEKVALSGDGGDEMFAGYDTYIVANRLNQLKWSKVLFPFTKAIESVYQNKKTRTIDIIAHPYRMLYKHMGFDNNELKQLFKDPEIYEAGEKENQCVYQSYGKHSDHYLDKIMNSVIYTWLVNDYLVKVDRASMYASLEVRSPFLDKDLAEFAATISTNEYLKNGQTKSILKDIAYQYLPHELINRQKQGFGIPIGKWFRTKLKDELVTLVLKKRQNIVDINYDFAEKIINDHLSGKDQSHKVWILYVFHKWIELNYSA